MSALGGPRGRFRKLVAGVGVLGVVAGCGGGKPVSPAEFYASETLEFVVPYEPGGGYDLYARDVAPYLAKCAGTEVTVINEPGAGGLLATSQTAVAEPDGLRIQILNTVGAVSAEVGQVEGLNFRLAEFSWLTRMSDEPNVVVVAADSEYRGFEDFLRADEPVKFVSTGPGANDHINPPLLSRIYDFPARVITGFSGSGEARSAILRGDADADVLPLNTALSAIRTGQMRPVLVIGRTTDKAVAEVPTTADFAPATPDRQRLLDSLVGLVETSRTVVAPPRLDPARLAYLREAFKCALSDPELQSRSKQQRRPVSYLPGAETGALVNSVLRADPAFQKVLQSIS
ncbi:Bug family tripartite tricarboxylate transporter substrate binding protein [Saccharopolyspora sp. 5N708]|uniref:Bug family tripartite tricarboxylate transporter substrate binding protein n=1 Tax=Saccharopolyspora sp. 5N708 TaxID=3457424 RepID=UPI003FD09F85